MLTGALQAQTPQPAFAEVPVVAIAALEGRVKGSSSAKIAVIEYSDFECPFCGRFAAGAYRDIQERFIDTGKVKYVFRHLPLSQHPHAMKAAEAAECAADQGKFWEYHNRLFGHQMELSITNLTDHARSLGLALPAFEDCLLKGRMSERVASDLASAKQFGLTATPAFMFGEIQGDGTVRATGRIIGSHPFAAFEEVLNQLLARVEQK